MGNAIQVNCAALMVDSIQCSGGWIRGVALNYGSDVLHAIDWAVIFQARKDKKNLGSPSSSSVEQVSKQEEAIYERMMAALPFRDVPSEAVERFYALPKDEQSVCSFLKRYGVFRRQDLSLAVRGGIPRDISRFLLEIPPNRRSPRFAIRLDDFWHEQALLKGVINICGLLKKKDVESADEVAAKLGLAYAGVALRMAFRDRMNVKVGGDFESGGSVPTISATFLLPALYAHVWNKIFERRPWAECVKCGTLFMATRPDKIHCSLRCKDAAKQQRYRDNKVQGKSKTKRGKR